MCVQNGAGALASYAEFANLRQRPPTPRVIRVEISQAADSDLAIILEYGWDLFGEAMATTYLRGFDEAFALIADHPLIGPTHDTVALPVRRLPQGSQRICYDVFKDRVVVQRVCTRRWAWNGIWRGVGGPEPPAWTARPKSERAVYQELSFELRRCRLLRIYVARAKMTPGRMNAQVSLAASLRAVSAAMERLAMVAETGDDAGGVSPPQPTMRDIERLAPALAAIAQDELRASAMRSTVVSVQLLHDGGWDMLLDLFAQQTRGRRVSITSICGVGHMKATTGLRYLRMLAAEGLVRRLRSQADGRVTYVELTADGYLRVGGWLFRRMRSLAA